MGAKKGSSSGQPRFCLVFTVFRGLIQEQGGQGVIVGWAVLVKLVQLLGQDQTRRLGTHKPLVDLIAGKAQNLSIEFANAACFRGIKHKQFIAVETREN